MSSKMEKFLEKNGVTLAVLCFTPSVGGHCWRQDTRLETSLALIHTGSSYDNVHHQRDIVTLLLMAKLTSYTCFLFINTAFVKEIQHGMLPVKVWCNKSYIFT